MRNRKSVDTRLNRLKAILPILLAALMLTSCAENETKTPAQTTSALIEGDDGEGIFTYENDDFTYELHYNESPQYIVITGVINENVFAYEIPVKIDGAAVTGIGEYAFIYAQLQTLTLHNGLQSISRGAFYNCAALTAVTLPSTLRELGDYAFYCCSLLEDVEIPDKLARIGGLAFYGTPWLDAFDDEFVIVGDGILLDYNGNGGEANIPDGVKFVSSAFYGCPTLTAATLPPSAAVIGNGAFTGAEKLAAVTLPNSLTEIGDSAFSGCLSLSSLTIPPSVSIIGVNAFEGCESLILTVAAGSFAESYAKENGIPCVYAP